MQYAPRKLADGCAQKNGVINDGYFTRKRLKNAMYTRIPKAYLTKSGGDICCFRSNNPEQ